MGSAATGSPSGVLESVGGGLEGCDSGTGDDGIDSTGCASGVVTSTSGERTTSCEGSITTESGTGRGVGVGESTEGCSTGIARESGVGGAKPFP